MKQNLTKEMHEAMLVSRRYALCNNFAKKAYTGIATFIRFIPSNLIKNEQMKALIEAQKTISAIGKAANEWEAANYVSEYIVI